MDIILGVAIDKKPFTKEKSLPLNILANYEIEEGYIGSLEFLLLKPITNLGTVDTIKKHMFTIKQTLHLPIAIYTKELSSFRRNSFIENQIPFISQKQIFLPFLGAYLEEIEEKQNIVDTFTPSTQVAAIRWLLNPLDRIKAIDLMQGLEYTTMTISRIAKQLEATDCFELDKDGVANVLVAKYSAKETFEKLRPYMISPLRTSGYAELPIEYDITLAGIEAVAERTNLNTSNLRTYAIYGNQIQLTKELVDMDNQVYIEIWKYDPKKLLWKDGYADPISVALSLEDNHDERIETAVNDMLETLWRGQ